MTSFVTDFLPIEVKPKAYYVQEKNTMDNFHFQILNKNLKRQQE